GGVAAQRLPEDGIRARTILGGVRGIGPGEVEGRMVEAGALERVHVRKDLRRVVRIVDEGPAQTANRLRVLWRCLPAADRVLELSLRLADVGVVCGPVQDLVAVLEQRLDRMPV